MSKRNPRTPHKRSRPHALLALALLGGATTPVQAFDCSTTMVQFEMNECAGQDFEVADRQLNAVYRQLAKRAERASTPDAKPLLAAAQRAWVGLRDAECAFRTLRSEGGMMHPMEEIGCRTELTRQRTGELKGYLACKPEDGSCPVSDR